MDRLTKAQRHKNMVAIHSTDTKPEVMLRKALWHKGVRYRKNFRVLGYQVDIAITKHKIAVFCDGTFWHGKDGDGSQVATNTKFWKNKIQRNKERDLEATITLRDAGWKVLRFWDDEIISNLDECKNKILECVEKCSMKNNQI